MPRRICLVCLLGCVGCVGTSKIGLKPDPATSKHDLQAAFAVQDVESSELVAQDTVQTVGYRSDDRSDLPQDSPKQATGANQVQVDPGGLLESLWATLSRWLHKSCACWRTIACAHCSSRMAANRFNNMHGPKLRGAGLTYIALWQDLHESLHQIRSRTALSSA